ncbi:MAG: hypothetical protein GQ570_13900 [Helicobacteraceae bacterium]|nr:hypothetical protein [Helicobacteraceae bacterium]
MHENGENSVQATFRKADDTGSERSQTDLTKEIPDQMNIENIAEANLAAVRTEDEMFGTLLDIKA